jgi:hypothetical protein
MTDQDLVGVAVVDRDDLAGDPITEPEATVMPAPRLQ